MIRLLAISLVVLLPMAYVGQTKKERSQRNNPPVIRRFTASQTVFPDCPTYRTSDNPEPNLLVVASDPDGDALSYEYSVDTGTISGKGREVVWKLGSWTLGEYHVKVKVTDGKGGEATSELVVRVVDHTACDAPQRPCPMVLVSCPPDVSKNRSTFSVAVKGEGVPHQSLSFSWTVIRGKIVSGQNSQSIEVEWDDPKDDSFTATVHVNGLGRPECGNAASCVIQID